MVAMNNYSPFSKEEDKCKEFINETTYCEIDVHIITSPPLFF